MILAKIEVAMLVRALIPAALLVAASSVGATQMWGSWKCDYTGLAQCTPGTRIEANTLEGIEDSIRNPVRPDLVSMALSYPRLQISDTGGWRLNLVYHRGGALTGHAHTRIYGYTGHVHYAFDDGQGGIYPSANEVPACDGFGKYCSSPASERQRFHSTSVGTFVCWMQPSGVKNCWSGRQAVQSNPGAFGDAFPIAGRVASSMPTSNAGPNGRRGGMLVEASATDYLEWDYTINHHREDIPQCAQGTSSPCSGTAAGVMRITNPPAAELNIRANCRIVGSGQSEALRCRFPMTRVRWLYCNLGFAPSPRYFSDQPLLEPPHSRAFEESHPCIPVSATGTEGEKTAGLKGAPGVEVSGGDPAAPCHKPNGNPCIPGTAEKLAFEDDFTFAGHEFRRAYRSQRKGRSFGYIDDNWTHTWGARLLTERTGGHPAAAYQVLSTASGDLLHFRSVGFVVPTCDPNKNFCRVVYRSVSDSSRVLVRWAPSGFATWRLTSPDGKYDEFDESGRLRASGFLHDPSRRITFNYVAEIHQLDHAWWAIKDVTDTRGRRIVFDYDLNKTYQPRLLRVYFEGEPDPTRQNLVRYEYWEQNDTSKVFWRLKQAVYPDGRIRRYVYGDHEPTFGQGKRTLLTGIQLGTAATIESSAIRFATYKYDIYGRVIDSFHGDSLLAGRVQLNYRPDSAPEPDEILPYTVRVTTALGNQRNYTYPALGFDADLNGLLRASTISDVDGTVSQTYNSNDPRCTLTGFGDWRTCTLRNARGFVELREYSGESLVRVTEALNSDQALSPTPETRTTATDWLQSERGLPTAQRVCAGKVACGPTTVWPVLRSAETWAYDSAARRTAHCEFDVSVGTPSTYVCGSLVDAPAHVRQTRYTYCTVAGDGCELATFGFLKEIDGPRTGAIVDVTKFYYHKSTDTAGCLNPALPCQRSGDLDRIVNALGHITTINRHDFQGRPTKITDANGVVTEFAYNESGRLVSRTVKAPSGGGDATTSITYDPASGVIRRVTSPGGAYVEYEHDAALRMKAYYDNLGNRVDYRLNAAGLVEVEKRSVAGEVGFRRAQEYDTVGRVLRQRDSKRPSGLPLTGADLDNPTLGRLVESHAYDPNGNRQQTTDGLLRVTNVDFDPLDRPWRVRDALRPDCPVGDAFCGNTITHYDAADRITDVIDPKGLTTRYGLDGLGQTDSVDSPDTGIATYLQDAAGNNYSHISARSSAALRSFDALNRPTTETHTDALGAIQQSTRYYDEANSITGCPVSYPKGRLTRIVDSTGTTVYCYDHRGNVIVKAQYVDGDKLALGYAYDLADRLVGIAYPDKTSVDYVRDSVGRVQSITVDGLPFVTLVQHYPWGPVRSLQFAAGHTLTKTYDTDYEIDLISSSRNGGLQLDFLTDVVGNITRIDQGGSVSEYEYDLLDRLRRVQRNGLRIDEYTYDALGNRLTAQSGSQPQIPYSYVPGTHRLGAVGSANRSYDAMGNTTNISNSVTPALTYDPANRLARAEALFGASFRYNALGQRLVKEFDIDSTHTQYVFDEGGKVLTLKRTNAREEQLRNFVYLDDLPVGVIEDGLAGTIETDHLGTPRMVVEGNTTIWRWNLVSGNTITGGSNAFGDRQAIEDPDGNGIPYVFELRFPGQLHDPETGLHYNYFRDYEPGTGRYVESDPIGAFPEHSNLGGSLQRATTINNLYSYANSRPFLETDSLGLLPRLPIEWQAANFGAKGGLGIAASVYTMWTGDWWANECDCDGASLGPGTRILVEGTAVQGHATFGYAAATASGSAAMAGIVGVSSAGLAGWHVGRGFNSFWLWATDCQESFGTLIYEAVHRSPEEPGYYGRR